MCSSSNDELNSDNIAHYINIVVARSEHCGTMQGVLAVVLVCLGAVDSFTFPGDWHKIRQMMEARKEKEAEVLSSI